MTKRRTLTLVFIVIIIFGVLLALDLANRGLAWRIFWNLTGEENPPAQLLGMATWAMNVTRAQPRTEPMVPIDYTYENPYGINVFLQEEVEPEKRERIVQMVSEAGFTWIRQQFPWQDIEIHGRGDFEDRRNDHDGDGQPDTISAWDKYDQIVDLTERYNLRIFARLDVPPAWSRSNPDAGDFAPPDDFQDFANYAATVAERYKGRIQYYQVWNEPNIYPEWGNQDVNPEAYTDLLCRTYDALKAVDPKIVVISGALASTVSLSGRDLNDYIFLQRMYDAGAAECFDILAIQGYGFNSGPTDRRMRPTTINFSHNLYMRDIMVANGDAHTPIWITEAAWNPQPRDPSVVQVLYGNYGIVTPEQAARYMPLAYQRAQEEWPWVGAIFYWFFKRPADYEINQSWYYFRMVEPDFTPLPIYDSMKQYIEEHSPSYAPRPPLFFGVYQAKHWAMHTDDNAMLIEARNAEFGKALELTIASMQIYGTDISLRFKGQNINVLIVRLGSHEFDFLDRREITVSSEAADDEWGKMHFKLSNGEAQNFGINIHASDDASKWLFDSITVIDRTYENLFGPVASLVVGVGMLALVIVRALWERKETR